MYSKARLAGHPIHPMIVTFPIAFYTSTVATLLAYVGTQEMFWYRVAMIANIAGIITAAIAVIPGAIDLMALPAVSRARRIGLKHAGFHALSTGLFVVTALLLYRSWSHRMMVDGQYVFDATVPLAMSVVAWVSMVIAGSLGWTLVQTHHVGIKPALTRADRPSREPELAVLDAIHALEALDALDALDSPYSPDTAVDSPDTVVDAHAPVDDFHAPPAAREARPPSMRH